MGFIHCKLLWLCSGSARVTAPVFSSLDLTSSCFCFTLDQVARSSQCTFSRLCGFNAYLKLLRSLICSVNRSSRLEHCKRKVVVDFDLMYISNDYRHVKWNTNTWNSGRQPAAIIWHESWKSAIKTIKQLQGPLASLPVHNTWLNTQPKA